MIYISVCFSLVHEIIAVDGVYFIIFVDFLVNHFLLNIVKWLVSPLELWKLEKGFPEPFLNLMFTILKNSVFYTVSGNYGQMYIAHYVIV